MSSRQNERGALIVEASIVFPVMFLVIIMMIYLGNAYFQKARVERMVSTAVSDGAAYCADPQLKSIEGGKLPTLSTLDVQPYRALVSNGGTQMAKQIEGDLKKRLKNIDAGYFSGMKPDVKSVSAKYNSHFIYATFEVTVNYEIELPIRMLGDTENIRLKFSTHRSMPVTDTVELIRNINMIEDYMQRIGVDKDIAALKEKISEAVGALGKWK